MSSAEINYTAQRVLRTLETVVLSPASAPEVARALGIHERTARRILRTLRHEQYLEYQVAPRGRNRHWYAPTPRLLALAAQLTPRLPLAERGRHATAQVHAALGLPATLAIPSYAEILVVAAAGDAGPRPWALLPAGAHAAGRALLAHRHPWSAEQSPQFLSDEDAAAIRDRGYAEVTRDGDGRGSLAVVLPAEQSPIAAVAVDGPCSELRERKGELIEQLQSAAARLAAALR